MTRVAAKVCCLARSGAMVVSVDTKPSAATKSAANFGETHKGAGFSGELLRCVSSAKSLICLRRRALHFIPQNRARGHEGLLQRFLGAIMPRKISHA